MSKTEPVEAANIEITVPEDVLRDCSTTFRLITPDYEYVLNSSRVPGFCGGRVLHDMTARRLVLDRVVEPRRTEEVYQLMLERAIAHYQCKIAYLLATDQVGSWKIPVLEALGFQPIPAALNYRTTHRTVLLWRSCAPPPEPTQRVTSFGGAFRKFIP